MANRFFLAPLITYPTGRYPKYFRHTRHCPACPLVASPAPSVMVYGFMPTCLVLLQNIDPGVLAFLQGQPDIYTFPEVLATPITDRQVIDPFFEALRLPTDWLTPSTEYIELLRKLAGMLQFNSRFSGIAREYALATPQGSLSMTATSLTDTGQDFSPWASGGYGLVVVARWLVLGSQYWYSHWASIETGAGNTATVAAWNNYNEIPGQREVEAVLDYKIVSATGRSIFDNGATLETRWNSLQPHYRIWFNATLASFGWPGGVSGNPKLRQLAKQAGDLWADSPFYMGGLEF